MRYHAFVDPSGGSSDSLTLAIAHAEGQRAVPTLIERRPPFSPDAVASEFVALLKSYRVRRVTGDRYGGEWPRERFKAHGIEYDIAELPKSEICLELLVALNSGRVELLDQPRLLAQLGGLERRTVRSGRDLVDHAPNAHDDVANAAAGAVTLVCGASTSALQVFAVDVGKSGTSPQATPSYGPRVTAFLQGE